MIDTPIFAESKAKGRHEPRWDYARYFGGQPSRVRSKNTNLLLYAQAFMWFHKIADFRMAEIHLLYYSNPGRTIRTQHKKIIDLLIREGREIVRRIRSSGGLIKPANGFSLEDIQSAIEELQNTQLQWNGSMSKARKEEILEGLFDATAR